MNAEQKNTLTPLMKQYYDIKNQYPDTLLLFQVGDFYELFFDDAKKASAFLGIALTARGKNNGEPIPLCGVPIHALDHYLTKLVRGGFKVAICDQLEEPKPGKVVERGVTQVLTPGTLTDTKLLDEKSSSYLFSFFPLADDWGLLFGELLTAQLFATVMPSTSNRLLESELVRFFPDEIVLPSNKTAKHFQAYFKKQGYFTSFIDCDVHDTQEVDVVTAWLRNQFNEATIKKLDQHESLRFAVYNFYNYIRKNQQAALEQFRQLHFYQPDDFLLLDAATQRNLELVKNNHDASRTNTLLAVMDGAVTSMGSRTIKKWILRPLLKHEAIVQRQDALAVFVEDVQLMQQLETLLQGIGDLERVIGRIALRRAQLHDYLLLMRALEIVPQIRNLLVAHKKNSDLLHVIGKHLGDFSRLLNVLIASLNDDATKDWLIKQGFDQQLDQLRELGQQGNQKIIELERKEQQATGIASLKIRYNQVHGYYIEVTKANAHLVPDHYIRQQTLVGRERFTIHELQTLQHDITRAHNEINQVEQAVFERIKDDVVTYLTDLRKLAHACAHVDALLGFANVAYNHGYVRPIFNDKHDVIITDGRHPVIECVLNNAFIPNDTALTDEQSLLIITGPNMGGKSTYLRQIALICIMAQCGSFVPAKSANLALLDRIFTRIGAGDYLAEGKSTFLVEMEETAAICTQATDNSLVILDEVGRGTSTFDGLAIAQAIVEYLYQKVQARCLFATHYHELTTLKDTFGGIGSYYAASKKTTNGILFLYKIIKGVADGSFGVEVAKLAELPDEVIQRAGQILETLTVVEQQHRYDIAAYNLNKSHQDGNDIIEVYEKLKQENKRLQSLVIQSQQKIQEQENMLSTFNTIDYDELSPKKAFDLLWELKER